METYNHLITQFHDSQTPSNNLLQLKSLADQLFRLRSSRKVHYLSKKNQLQALQQEQQTSLSFSRMSSTIRSSSLSSFSTSKQDLVDVDRHTLKKKKEELQKEISVLREKNQTLANQLNLFLKKQAEIDNLNKKSELEVFNAVQALYIEASKQNQQEAKEEQLLRQLKSRRQNVAQEIEDLIRDQQANDEVVRRWSRIKEIKANPVKNNSQDVSEMKQMLISLLNLDQMIMSHSQIDGQSDKNYQDCRQQIALLNSKIQITSFLYNSYFKIDDKFASKAIEYHKLLQNQFDRNERANKQINQHLQALHNKHMELAEILEKAHLQKQRLAKEHLKQTQFSLKGLQESFNARCRLISNFTTKFYMILKRMQSLRNTVNSILNSAKNQKLRQKCCGDSDIGVILRYDEQLNKNPEDILVRWYQSLGSSSQFYHGYIEDNDLLRILSCPESYNPRLDDLTNYEMFMVSCFRSAQDFTKKMAEEIDTFFKYCRYDPKLTSEKNLLKTEDNQFCVESMDYYRRDNYKLLQKLKQNELRKKGLLIQIPFNVCLENELVQKDQQKQQQQFSTLITPRTTERNRKYMKYTDLASKREERSMRNSVVRKLFDRLNSFRSQSTCRFKTLNSLKQSRLTMNHLKDQERKSVKRLSIPRKTVGTVQKENSQRY